MDNLYKIKKFLKNACIFKFFVLECNSLLLKVEVNTLPNIKSAKKRVKVIATKTLRNQMIKTNIKTCIKSFEAYVSEADKANAAEAFKLVVKKLDQAVAKGIMHKNTAARKKSQLAIKLAKIA